MNTAAQKRLATMAEREHAPHRVLNMTTGEEYDSFCQAHTMGATGDGLHKWARDFLRDAWVRGYRGAAWVDNRGHVWRLIKD